MMPSSKCFPRWKTGLVAILNLYIIYLIFVTQFVIITLLPFFIEMLQHDWLLSGHMIIKEMFYIPIKLKHELARSSMTASDVNKQCNGVVISNNKYSTNKIHNEKCHYITFWCDLNVIIRNKFLNKVLSFVIESGRKLTIDGQICSRC
jgi:hypothetical protein